MTSMTTATRNHASPDMTRTYASPSPTMDQYYPKRPASATDDYLRKQSPNSPTYLIRGAPLHVEYGGKPKAGRRRSNTLPAMPITNHVDRFQQRTYEYVSPKPGTPPVNYNLQYNLNRPRSSTYSAGQKAFPSPSFSTTTTTAQPPKGILVRQPLSRQNSQDKTVQFQGPLVDDEKITTNKYPEEKYPSPPSTPIPTPVKSIYADMPPTIPNYEKDPPSLRIEDPLPVKEQVAFEHMAAEQPKPDPTPLPEPLRHFEDSLQRELMYDEMRNTKPPLTFADVGVGFSDSPFTPGHVSPPPLTDVEKKRGEKRYRFAYPKPAVLPRQSSLDRHLQQEEMQKIADMEGKMVTDTIMCYWHELAAQQESELH